MACLGYQNDRRILTKIVLTEKHLASKSRFMILASLMLTSIFLFPQFSASAHSGISLSGFATMAPVIDGIMGTSEWDNAGLFNVTFAFPGGGMTAGSVLAMNDESNLYLAVRFEQSSVNLAGDVADFHFDNNHSGGSSAQVGDDYVGCFASFGLSDQYNFDPAIGTIEDQLSGGTSDGSCAFGNDGIFSLYEISHPLNDNDDLHDFSLQSGDTIGFMVGLGITGPDGNRIDSSSPSSFPFNNQESWHDIIIASPAPSTTHVDIDVIPHSTKNTINPKSGGIVPVAILTSSTFDALTVDEETASFGPNGATAIRSKLADVDHDGDLDKILIFKISETGLSCDQTEATVTAQSKSGAQIQGSDNIRLVPC
jgi:hypothetical protein